MHADRGLTVTDRQMDRQTSFSCPARFHFYAHTHKRTRTNRRQTDTAGRQAHKRRFNGTLNKIKRASRSLLRQVYVGSCFLSFWVDLGASLGVPGVCQNCPNVGLKGAPEVVPRQRWNFGFRIGFIRFCLSFGGFI